jgi:hypothetical protein
MPKKADPASAPKRSAPSRQSQIDLLVEALTRQQALINLLLTAADNLLDRIERLEEEAAKLAEALRPKDC